MQIVDVSWVPPLVCAVANIFIGSFWYAPNSPTGKIWFKELGITKEKMKAAQQKDMTMSYLLAFAGAYIAAYVFAHMLAFAEATTLSESLQGAFWMWLGFPVPILLSGVLWEQKSVKYFLVNIGYYAVSFAAFATIITLMK